MQTGIDIVMSDICKFTLSSIKQTALVFYLTPIVYFQPERVISERHANPQPTKSPARSETNPYDKGIRK